VRNSQTCNRAAGEHDIEFALSGPIARGPECTRCSSCHLERFASLMEEVATYFSYLAAIRDLFTNDLDMNLFLKASQAGLIEILASARRAMSVNHSASRAALEVFRKAWAALT
jgi:hypothetical protein